MDTPENDNLPLEDMAVMQEPPIDVEDTPPTGVYRRFEEPHKTNPRITDRIKTPGSSPRWINRVLSGAAMIITLLAGIIYLQQGNAPVPQPTQDVVIIEATAEQTKIPTLSPTVA